MSQIVLKIQAQEKTKRVQALPDSFDALKSIVEASFFKQQVAPIFSLRYRDGDDEIINLSDDEDLQTAYDVAKSELGSKLSLQVVPIDGMAIDQSEVASVAASFRQDSVMAEPAPKGCCVKKPACSEPKNNGCSKAYAMTTQEEKPVPSKRFDEEGDSSSSDDEEETKGDARHKHHGGRRHHGRGGHHGGGKKGKRALPMKKVYKKLIQRELDRQAPSILEQVIREARDAEMASDAEYQKARVTKHVGVACDGCGLKDIIGYRFKCAVCKDFDFCEICEERLTHAHPFIKITSPELAPASISVALHEHQFENVAADNQQASCCAGFPGLAEFCRGRDWKQAAECWMNKETAGKPGKRSSKKDCCESFCEALCGDDAEECCDALKEACGYGGLCESMSKGNFPKGIFKDGKPPKHIGGLIKKFCQKINADPQKRDEICSSIGSCINNFLMTAADGGCCGFGQEAETTGDPVADEELRGQNPKRAQVIQRPDIIFAKPGQTVFAQIRVKNNTKWPWRNGCYLNSIFNSTPVDIPRVHVDKEVRGGDEFDLSVPVSIAQFEEMSDKQWKVSLSFYRNDGKQMGTPFALTVGVEGQGQNEDNLKAAAQSLCDAQMGTLDECFAALLNAHGDENVALQALNEAKAKKEAEMTD